MSPQEVTKLISTPQSLKSKTIIAFFYATGLRVNEATYVKLSDIDRAAMHIKVTHGKGSKERYALLSPVLLKQLTEYYRQYRPEDYLFNGSKKGSRMGNRAMQLVMQNAVKKAGLNKTFSLHTLRHSFATHLLDQGCNIHTIKELLGHSFLQTTMIYLHLTVHVRQQIVSPLDRLSLQP
jgi:site-specific recombinase XerD